VRPTGISSLVLASILMLALGGCAIGRVYRGSPIQGDPETDIRPGITDRAEILSVFGAPDRIVSRPAGEVFIYRFTRENSRSFTIEEPVITNFKLFSYSVVEEREDRLVVLFEPGGTVESYGYLKGTQAFED
jgi:hypothetical protein